MSDPIIGLLGFAFSLLLILFGVPVAISLGLTGVLGFAFLNGFNSALFILGSGPFEAISPYSLSVVPLFLIMGIFASHAKLSSDLFKAANAFVGQFRGGLAMATIGACAGFGAISGSSLATVATMGRVAMPEMRKAGYDDRLSSASIAAAGTLGVLIPPSILLIIYGLLTQQSIGQLFSAAIIPGIIGTVLYSIAVVVQVRISPEMACKTSGRLDWRTRIADLKTAWPIIGLFLLVIGGIQVGLFSPTEAASVGAGGAILLAFSRKKLSRNVLVSVMWEAAEMTGMVFLVMIGAALFNFFIETTGLPQLLIDLVNGSGLPPLSVLICVLIFYILLGSIMDAMSMILLTVPFIFPMINALGYDPIWFGVIIVTVAELGLITPPIGMNLFVVQGTVSGLQSSTVIKGILPFICADVVRLVILVSIPGLVLWLPRLMY